MPAIQTPQTLSIDEWRQKTDQMGQLIGDPQTLATTDKTTIVGAVNEAVQKANDAFTIAIALG